VRAVATAEGRLRRAFVAVLSDANAGLSNVKSRGI
jgi:hypothetical protein